VRVLLFGLGRPGSSRGGLFHCKSAALDQPDAHANVQRTLSPDFPPAFGGNSRYVRGQELGEKGAIHQLRADFLGLL
jgi:hypothetical protein